MDFKLLPEQEHLVLDNQNFIRYLLKIHGISQSAPDYDDLFSIGNIGLIKAAITYDSSKGIKFSTYASRCINNELGMYFRKYNKYANDISLDAPIKSNSHDDEEGELPLYLLLPDDRQNFTKKIVEENTSEQTFIQIFSIILNFLGFKEQQVLLYKLGNFTKREIGDILNISGSYVSKIERTAIGLVRKVFKQRIHYREIFFVEKKYNFYKITFYSKDVSNFNSFFPNLLLYQKSASELPDFEIDCNKDRVVIKIPSQQPEAFVFVAKIMQEIKVNNP